MGSLTLTHTLGSLALTIRVCEHVLVHPPTQPSVTPPSPHVVGARSVGGEACWGAGGTNTTNTIITMIVFFYDAAARLGGRCAGGILLETMPCHARGFVYPFGCAGWPRPNRYTMVPFRFCPLGPDLVGTLCALSVCTIGLCHT